MVGRELALVGSDLERRAVHLVGGEWEPLGLRVESGLWCVAVDNDLELFGVDPDGVLRSMLLGDPRQEWAPLA